MKKILFYDKNPESACMLSLNLTFYLGREIEHFGQEEDFIATINSEYEYDLIILNNYQEQKIIIDKSKEALQKRENPIPLIYFVESTENAETTKNVYALKFDDEIKPLIKTAAKILGVTPKQMAGLKLPPYISIPNEIINYLMYFPCETFQAVKGEEDKFVELFQDKEKTENEEVTSFLKENGHFYIKSNDRLKLANSLREQIQELSEKVSDKESTASEKLAFISKSLNIISNKFRSGKVSEEVIELAEKSIDSSVDLVESVNDLSELMVLLKDSVRLSHAYVLTYMNLNVLKHIDWWIEDEVKNMAMASFFHDIYLEKDDHVLISTEEELNKYEGDEEEKEKIKHHAKTISENIIKLNNVAPQTITILKEHHGSQEGVGFSKNLEGLNNLSKIFIITEEWVHEILRKSGNNFDQIKFEEKLTNLFQDPDVKDVISALSKVEIADTISLIFKDIISDEENEIKVKGETPEDQDVDFVRIIRSSLEDTDTEVFHFMGENTDLFKDSGNPTLIKGITDKMDELKIIVKDNLEEDGSLRINVISSVTEIVNNVTQIVKDNLPQELSKISKMKDDQGRTKLMLAALQGNAVMVEMLSKDQGTVQLKDKVGMNVLHYAAMGGNIEVIDRCLNLKINVNSQDSKKRTPLFFTIYKDQTEAAIHLIGKGSWVNVKFENNMTLPILASHKGNEKVLLELIKSKAPLKGRDFKGRSAFHYARSSGHKNILEILKENGLTS